jgi:hypothetical protein
MKSKISTETLSKMEEQEQLSSLKQTEKKSQSQSTWSNFYRGVDLETLGFSKEEILDILGGHYGDF